MNTILLAVLNSLWQSALLAAAVWLVLRVARGTDAATRQALWWATLAVAIALPLIPPRQPETPSAPATAIAAAPIEPEPPAPEPVASPAQNQAALPSHAPIQLPGGNWP